MSIKETIRKQMRGLETFTLGNKAALSYNITLKFKSRLFRDVFLVTFPVIKSSDNLDNTGIINKTLSINCLLNGISYYLH